MGHGSRQWHRMAMAATEFLLLHRPVSPMGVLDEKGDSTSDIMSLFLVTQF